MKGAAVLKYEERRGERIKLPEFRHRDFRARYRLRP
jgi:hypothetical protein